MKYFLRCKSATILPVHSAGACRRGGSTLESSGRADFRQTRMLLRHLGVDFRRRGLSKWKLGVKENGK